jgi:hypothetical protein
MDRTIDIRQRGSFILRVAGRLGGVALDRGPMFLAYVIHGRDVR